MSSLNFRINLFLAMTLLVSSCNLDRRKPAGASEDDARSCSFIRSTDSQNKLVILDSVMSDDIFTRELKELRILLVTPGFRHTTT